MKGNLARCYQREHIHGEMEASQKREVLMIETY